MIEPKLILSKTFFLSASEANPEQEMSIAFLTENLIEIATQHANELGIGNPSMIELKAGWILARLTIEMSEYPKVNDSYILSTWIEDFNRHYSTRCFKIEGPNGKIFGYARSIWMVMDINTHANIGLSHFKLSKDLIEGTSVPIPLQAKPLLITTQDIEDCKKCIRTELPPSFYRFKYSDLDFYRHVNTVSYVRLLLNSFSLQDHDLFYIKRLELCFQREGQYDMEVALLQKKEEENLNLFSLVQKNDNTQILFSRVYMQKRFL